MNKFKIMTLSLMTGSLLLTSCSSTSCFNPCNWRPSWKNSCNKQYSCCDYQNSYEYGNDESGYDSGSGYGYESGGGYGYESGGGYGYESGSEYGTDNDGGYDEQFNSYDSQANFDSAPYETRSSQTNTNKAFSPYPNTSIEDVNLPRYIPEEQADIKDVPYYDEKNIIKDNSSIRSNSYQQRDTSVRQRNVPINQDPQGPAKQRNNPEKQEETPTIQQKDLAKIKSAHQRVLDRYKQRKTQDDPVTFEDSEYFDQIIKKVISKEQKN